MNEIIKIAPLTFGMMMLIASLALIVNRTEFTTYELLATIYIWVTCIAMAAQLHD
jgi:hypothetical protein